MYTELFEDVGLSPNEAKIYETLLSLGECGVSKISVKANIHRRNIYDALNRLIEKGLVFRVFQKGEQTFQAVHPQKLFEVIHAKEQKLKNVLPQLTHLYETIPSDEAAFIYRGVEGFKNYMRDLVRVGEETLFLGAKALWFSPQVDQTFLSEFIQTARRKKFQYYTIFDHRVQEQFPNAIPDVGGNYKILPPKYSTPGVVDIFGDYVVTFTSVDIANFGEDGTIFVMVNKELAESYRKWFWFIWDHCPEHPKEKNVNKKNTPK